MDGEVNLGILRRGVSQALQGRDAIAQGIALGTR